MDGKVDEDEDEASDLEVDVLDAGAGRARVLRQASSMGTVKANRVLTAPGAPEKRHIGEHGTVSLSTER